MPVLRANGSIVFASAGEFRAQWQQHILQGGLLVESDIELPLRQVRVFTLVVEGVDTTVTFQAEVVFSDAGRLGLQLKDPTGCRGDIEKLLASLPAHEASPEQRRQAPAPARAPDSGIEVFDLQGMIVPAS